jgi:hypothetical protein
MFFFRFVFKNISFRFWKNIAFRFFSFMYLFGLKPLKNSVRQLLRYTNNPQVLQLTRRNQKRKKFKKFTWLTFKMSDFNFLKVPPNFWTNWRKDELHNRKEPFHTHLGYRSDEQNVCHLIHLFHLFKWKNLLINML